MFCRDSAWIIVLFVVIHQILLPLQKTFLSFTWGNKETIFFSPNTVLEAEHKQQYNLHAQNIVPWTFLFVMNKMSKGLDDDDNNNDNDKKK